VNCHECGTQFDIEDYGDGECPRCVRRYVYEEAIVPSLDGKDWDAIVSAKAGGQWRREIPDSRGWWLRKNTCISRPNIEYVYDEPGRGGLVCTTGCNDGARLALITDQFFAPFWWLKIPEPPPEATP